MATTTNYGWVTPDNTDLVKDGASAIRTLGSSIDTTLKAQIDAQIPDTLLTTTGDVIYASAANTPARLGVGAAGQVLTVAGGIPSWASPAGALSIAQIASGSLPTGTNTLTLSGLTQDYLLLRVSGATIATTAGNLTVRINADATALYNQNAWYITSSNPVSAIATSATSIAVSQTITGGAGIGASTMLTITNNKTTGYKTFSHVSLGNPSVTGMVGNGIYLGSAATTSLQINCQVNFTGGTYTLWGA